MFPCEYSKIFKTIFFSEHLRLNSLLPRNCFSVFDHLVGLVLKGLKSSLRKNSEKGFLMILGKIKVN